MLEQAVRDARAAGDQHLVAPARNFIANGLYHQGDWTSAGLLFKQVREGFQSVNSLLGVAIVTVQIGLC